jgi:glycosyltransferase involved in cell wall biosynthesis
MAPEDPYSDYLTAMGCIYHPLKMNNTGSSPGQDLLLLSRLYRLYRNIRPDVVLHYTIKPNIYGTLIAGLLKIPSISTVSGLGTVFLTPNKFNSIARFLYSVAFRYPGRIFFQNESDLKVFKDKGLLRKNNFLVIPGSGIDTLRFKPASAPPLTPFVFLMMARLIVEKGVNEYLEAARIIQSEGLPVVFQILGSPDPQHQRGIQLEELKSWPVEYLGEAVDVRDYIGNAHVVVLPSYREGLSRSLLEAAAMEKPIVATDVPGCREVVKDQINGLLCKPADAEDLANKMKERVSLTDSQLKEMGAAGRRLVVENFSEERVVGIYLDTIREIV